MRTMGSRTSCADRALLRLYINRKCKPRHDTRRSTPIKRVDKIPMATTEDHRYLIKEEGGDVISIATDDEKDVMEISSDSEEDCEGFRQCIGASNRACPRDPTPAMVRAARLTPLLASWTATFPPPMHSSCPGPSRTPSVFSLVKIWREQNGSGRNRQVWKGMNRACECQLDLVSLICALTRQRLPLSLFISAFQRRAAAKDLIVELSQSCTLFSAPRLTTRAARNKICNCICKRP
ncbi:hypothetical protein DFH09DRAFT_296877 [Mycena vulgaris]|nr:hypothetical protein DFH09DRAFT_296877 [Mycena vulgaris]